MEGCDSFCFFKQKTAYEMRISDWSSDVCSSDLLGDTGGPAAGGQGYCQRPSKGTAGPAGSHCQAEIARVRRQATASSHTLRTAHEFSLLYRSADLCLGGRALHPARWRPDATGSSDRTIRSEKTRVWDKCVSQCRPRGFRYH